MQHHVFLSYSRQDTTIMEQVRDDLRAVGLRVWTGENIEPGSITWKPAIETALKDAGCLVAILSPDAAESPWVLEELDTAESLDMKIFLILTRGDRHRAIPASYLSHPCVDIRQNANRETQMERLIQAVRDFIDDETRTLIKPPTRSTGEYLAVPPQAVANSGRPSSMKIVITAVLIVAIALVVWLVFLGGWTSVSGA